MHLFHEWGKAQKRHSSNGPLTTIIGGQTIVLDYDIDEKFRSCEICGKEEFVEFELVPMKVNQQPAG